MFLLDQVEAGNGLILALAALCVSLMFWRIPAIQNCLASLLMIQKYAWEIEALPGGRTYRVMGYADAVLLGMFLVITCTSLVYSFRYLEGAYEFSSLVHRSDLGTLTRKAEVLSSLREKCAWSTGWSTLLAIVGFLIHQVAQQIGSSKSWPSPVGTLHPFVLTTRQEGGAAQWQYRLESMIELDDDVPKIVRDGVENGSWRSDWSLWALVATTYQRHVMEERGRSGERSIARSNENRSVRPYSSPGEAGANS